MSMNPERQIRESACDVAGARLRSAHGNEEAETLRFALRRQEAACATGAPAFASIASRIAERPSDLDAAPWPAKKSARVAGALALAQIRVVPYTVGAAALVMAACAATAARFASTALPWLDPLWLFSALLLAGAAVTASLALASERADSLALAMPIGVQTVTLARLVAVLGIDVVAGIASAGLAALLGLPVDAGDLVFSWLVPLAAVSGVAAFSAVWTGSPWAASIVGIGCVPLVVPVANAVSDLGAFSLVAAVQGAIGPRGVAVLGAALFAATVCTARRAMIARMEAA